jgi:hypothetical protein
MTAVTIVFVVLLASVGPTRTAPAATAGFERPEPPGPHCPLKPRDLTEVQSYAADQPVVGTHFFYWYDIESGAHFLNHDGSDALVDHPVHTQDFSYRSVAWWKRELSDVSDAGIDFILPVYWGCPGDYDGWSFAGLPPMVRAWEELAAEGQRPPRVGLFYDTSTLRHTPGGRHIDLRTTEGKDWFYTTIRDFFSFVPPRMWAAVEGRPIVVLYGANFAAAQDPAAFPYAREQFRQDFATDMFLVKNVGWEGEADRVCSWGGALGLKPYSVASLGPGYDHHAVPNREPLVVEREGGRFYSDMWERFLAYNPERRADIVLVETWNELHEGTDVCETREYGRQYIRLTAKYADLFREGVVLPRTGPFAQADRVVWDAAQADENLGISPKPQPDGLLETVQVEGRACRQTRESQYPGRFVYLDLDDSFLFDEDGAGLTLAFEYVDRGFDTASVQYDSADPAGSVHEGAFKSAALHVSCESTGRWKTAVVQIDDGRFANRCNNGDLRLSVTGGDLCLRRVVAERSR